MKPILNIKLILLISLCVFINVIITKVDKVIPGEFSTWVEKIPLENPKWALYLKNFDGCRSKCGHFCTGKPVLCRLSIYSQSQSISINFNPFQSLSIPNLNGDWDWIVNPIFWGRLGLSQSQSFTFANR